MSTRQSHSFKRAGEFTLHFYHELADSTDRLEIFNRMSGIEVVVPQYLVDDLKAMLDTISEKEADRGE